MASLTEIKRFIEGTDFIGEIQADATKLEDSNMSDITAAYNDLAHEVANEPEYQDIFSDRYSEGLAQLKTVTQAAQSYLQGCTLGVERPNWYQGETDPYGNPYSPYINLYQGEDGYGADANIWDDLVNNPSAEISNNGSDAYYTEGLGCDWGFSGRLNFSNTQTGVTGYGGFYGYAVGFGTVADWMPFLHVLSTGNASALNAAAMMG